jgi:hypothetical protein
MYKLLAVKNGNILFLRTLTQDIVSNVVLLDQTIRTEIPILEPAKNYSNSINNLKADYLLNKGINIIIGWSESELQESGAYTLVTYPESVNNFMRFDLKNNDDTLETIRMLENISNEFFLISEDVRDIFEDLRSNELAVTTKLELIDLLIKLLRNQGINLETFKYV